jgi:hypothetical protein
LLREAFLIDGYDKRPSKIMNERTNERTNKFTLNMLALAIPEQNKQRTFFWNKFNGSRNHKKLSSSNCHSTQRFKVDLQGTRRGMSAH